MPKHMARKVAVDPELKTGAKALIFSHPSAGRFWQESASSHTQIILH
jgi:hypothetical protein